VLSFPALTKRAHSKNEAIAGMASASAFKRCRGLLLVGLPGGQANQWKATALALLPIKHLSMKCCHKCKWLDLRDSRELCPDCGGQLEPWRPYRKPKKSAEMVAMLRVQQDRIKRRKE